MAGTQRERIGPAQPALVDWPTLAAIVTFWGCTVALVLGGQGLPTWFVLTALALLGCFYMSLQHEVIHGHPTPWARLNWCLVAIPLGLLQPFSQYRAMHVAHHASDLTDPLTDPESFYVLPQAWQAAGTLRRSVWRLNRTLLARLTIGPALATGRSVVYDARAARRDRAVLKACLLHVPAAAAVVLAVRAGGLPLWIYAVGFVFGGSALTALRSFVEHQAVAVGPRSAVVRSNWFFGLLFLNNNLHFTHHQLPGAAWYRLPELTRTLDAETIVADAAGAYRGYGEVIRRFAVRPFDQPVHPLSDSIRA